MSTLQVFTFPESGQDVNIHVDDRDVLWFRATGVCAVLGFANPSVAVDNHCPDSYREFKIGMGRPANYVNEGGLYRLIFASKAPVADRFRDWVCDEVLPSIRKTGSYSQGHDQATPIDELFVRFHGLKRVQDKLIDRMGSSEDIDEIFKAAQSLDAVRRNLNSLLPSEKPDPKKSIKFDSSPSENPFEPEPDRLEVLYSTLVRVHDRKAQLCKACPGWLNARLARQGTRLVRSANQARQIFQELAANGLGEVQIIKDRDLVWRPNQS